MSRWDESPRFRGVAERSRDVDLSVNSDRCRTAHRRSDASNDESPEHPGLEHPAALDEWCLYGRLNEDGESRTIPLTPLPFRIGRRSGLSLSLSHQTVSGLHAEIDLRDQQLFVRDLHSTNGTFINGTQLFGEQEIFENDLLQFADVAFRVARRLPDTKSHTRCANASDQALALVQFDRLVEHGALAPYFQPIVDLTTNQAVAFEALARSRFVGLETPEFMFAAAAQLGRVNELTQLMRRKAVETSGLFPDAAPPVFEHASFRGSDGGLSGELRHSSAASRRCSGSRSSCTKRP